MSRAGENELLRMIEALRAAGSGDEGRLSHITETVRRGRVIYHSDRQYVERKFAELGGSGSGSNGGGGATAAAPSEATNSRQGEARRPRKAGDSPPPTAPPSPRSPSGLLEQPSSGGGTDGTDGTGISPPPPPRYAAPQYSDELGGERPGNKVEAGRAGTPRGRSSGAGDRASAAWYLLPIFMSIIGGIISYAALRHRDRSRARKTLVLGAALFGLLVAAAAAIVMSGSSVDMRGTEGGAAASYAGMTDAEIKRASIEVPYAALAADPAGHAGMIIRYDGHIVQAERDLLWNSYVMRIGTDLDEIGLPGEDIWSEYAPRTDAEERWLDGLDREGLIMPGEDSRASAWGLFRGLQEYDTLFGGKRYIPAVDVLILERGG